MKHKSNFTVLLGARSEYRGILAAVAHDLKESYGASVHLYCTTSQEKDFYATRHAQCFDTISVDRSLYSGCRQAVADVSAEIATARRNEIALGVTYNHLSMSDRHLGRGFALGGFKHPRSYLSRETSYAQLIQGYNRSIAFWRHEIEEKRADLIIGCGRIASAVAQAENTPYRTLAASRYRNLYYWATNELLETPILEEVYRKISAPVADDITAPYDAHELVRKTFARRYTLRGALGSIAFATLRQFYWRIRGYEKARSYVLGDVLRSYWQGYRDHVEMSSARTIRLADLKGQPFVFYPLHTEPEASVQTLSPEYFYQLSSIAALSRDLPAGVVLAVKEHFAALGRRPSDFHAQIREFKNVVILNVEELGLDCARQAIATATITGTSGFEAAVMGLPVVSFGRHNLYNFLPHVMLVEREEQLAGFLRRIFDGEINAEEARRDGMRFLQAIVDISFCLGNYRHTHPDEIPDDVSAAATRALIANCGICDAVRHRKAGALVDS